MARRGRSKAPAAARRPSAVDPSLRMSVALGVSLLLWWTTATAALAGHVDVATAGGRYLLALLVAWVGTGLVVRVIDAYAAIDPPVPADAPAPAGAGRDGTLAP